MLKKIAIATFLFQFIFSTAFSQTVTNTAELKRAAAIQAQKENEEFSRAMKLAQQKGWPTSFKTYDGNIAFLVRINERGYPEYLTTTSNVTAANTIGTSGLWAGGSLGLNLSGSSPNVKDKMALWDGGRVRADHDEFANRVLQLDNPSSLSDHATHVAGTMMAAGINGNAKGMAHGSLGASAFDFQTGADSEMMSMASTLLLSNHSYGVVAGWQQLNATTWRFHGLMGENEDFKFGYYDGRSQLWDSIAYNAPYYLIVSAAGNNRSTNGPSIGGAFERFDPATQAWVSEIRGDQMKSNDGYDIIPPYGNAKNILTVGAVTGLTNGYQSPNSVSMSTFSSWGPTDDGRIKPDLVSMGVGLFSPISSSITSYATFSGTSMAAPNVTGSMLLLQEHYSQLNQGNFMRAATLKGLAIHTADEAGPADGPDYTYGWGLMNSRKAANVITSRDTGSHRIIESVLNNAASYSTTIKANGPLTVTLSWTDPKGNVILNSLNNPSLKLVHDLDVKVVTSSGTHLPWILDPANPSAAATRGDNFRDNVEKIFVPNPPAGENITITVTHKGTLLRGSQAFSLIISGIASRDHDMTITEIVSPKPNNCENNAQYVTIRLKNLGTQPKTNLPVFLTIKEGSTVIQNFTSVYTGSITLGNTADFTFQTPVNLVAGSTYNFQAVVSDLVDESKNNDTLSVNVTILQNPLTPSGAGVLCGSTAFLKVNTPQSGVNFFWYTGNNEANPVAAGSSTTTTTIPSNNTYFVGRGVKGTVGLPGKSGFGGSYISSTDLATSQYMKYTSTAPLILETARLYTKKAGKINFIVAKLNGSTVNVLSTTTIDVMASSATQAGGNQPDDASDNGRIYHLNLNLPAGDNVILVQTQGDANIFRNDNVTGNPYPFSIPGVISFTGNSSTNFQNFYFFLYDMKVRTSDCISSRNSVVITNAPTPVITQSADQLVSSIDFGNQWYVNNNVIIGAVSKTYKPPFSGNYTVQVVDNFGCQMNSAGYNYVVSSLVNLPATEIGLLVSPNPSKGSFVIRFNVEKREDLQVEMKNIQGQNVYERSYPRFQGSFNEQVNLKALAAGVYVLRVRQGNKVYHQKIVIE
jgi:hypothetical protein